MRPLKMGELFAGYGGLGSLGIGSVLPVEPVWFCEYDKAPSKILAHHYPDVPNLGDITAVDWATVERVDVLTGGFPCQDVSHAGRRAGLIRDGEGRTRSGLWGHMLRAVDQLKPRLVVAENVRGLLSAAADSDVEPCPWCLGDANGEPDMRALGAVLADLADVGYDAWWVGLRAADVGAAHGRFRVFIFATPRDTTGDDVWHGTIAGGRRPGRALVEAGGADSAAAHADGWRRQDGPELNRDTSQAAALPNEVAYRWGDYAAAIARWESVIGRAAPAPTERGPVRHSCGGDESCVCMGNPRLSPLFVEWLMGLPAGHVTDTGLTRNEQLKALGNGVVPQQAAAATRWWLTQIGAAA